MRRLLTVAAFAALITAALGGVASAHPLGNFTVNTYSGLQVSERQLRVDYIIDMAEIPTFQARAAVDTNGDGQLTAPELEAYAASTCKSSTGGLAASVNGGTVALAVDRSHAEQRPGQAGLPTMRISCVLSGAVSGLRTGSVVTYANRNFEGRIGWREVTAVGDGTTITSADVPARSTSARLTAYPKNLLQSPLDVRSARLVVRPGGPASGPVADRGPTSALPRGIDAATTAFSAFVGRRHLSLGVGLAAVALALLLGAVHAVAPGHGKTVMAAYLVGRHSSLRSALTVGATVTATHTAGVLALGILLSVSSAFAPERLFPVLGLVSGLMLVGIGAWLLRGALQGRAAGHSHGPGGHHHEHPHSDGPSHGHAHADGPSHGHPHADGPADDHRHDHLQVPATVPTRRSLVVMGLAGGMVPSPSALVVLLGAIALHRAWFGVVLVVCYGLGMATTLTMAGLLLVRGRSWLDRRQPARWSARFARALPVGTAGLITLVGLGLALRAAAVVVA
jgi:nickel/cobalt exporter